MLLRLDEPQSQSLRTRLKSLFGSALTLGLFVCWAISVGGLVTLFAWMILDPHFADAAAWVNYDLNSILPNGHAILPDVARDDSIGRQRLLEAMVAAWLLSNLSILIGLFFGPIRHRRLSSWLGVITVSCAAIALMMAWSDVLWFGREFRVSQRIDSLEPTAKQLQNEWPLVDGDLPGVGPFSAYPYGRATCLLRLTQPDDRSSELTYQSIERSPAGGLRFQLGGAERGAWLEWHPRGERPDSFRGGLAARYQLDRATHLRDGWYLTRYSALLNHSR